MLPPDTRRLSVSPVPSPAQFIRRDRNLSPPAPNFRNSSFICLSHPRRSIRHSNRDRKTVKELERECDEDDGDDVPDDCFLDNVPISPRPPSQQSLCHSKSTLTSPERPIRRKGISFRNGTSAQPAEQGELRSPRASNIQKDSTRKLSIGDYHSKTRGMSWSAAMFDLSQETKKLTQALEEYERTICESGSIPYIPPDKLRVKSVSTELPPLRRTEMMIEPLPISKEKEAVLSRTRPSWLPPKDPAEERRHVKEYQRMMANFLQTDRKNIVIGERHQSLDKIKSRQERMQQRLRGVLRREIKDVDFGLTFPTTLKGESQSLQHPPEPTLTPQTISTQRDIIKNPILSSSITPRNQASLIQNIDAPEGSGEHFNPFRSANANTSKKRRTLDKNERISLSSQSSRKSQEKSNSQNSQRFRDDFNSNTVPIYAFPDESNNSIDKFSQGNDKSDVALSYLKVQKLGRTPRRSQGIQVVTESPTNAPGSGQRVQLDQQFSQDLKFTTEHSNSRKRANDSTPSLPPKRRKDRSRDKAQSFSLFEEEKSAILNSQNDDHDDNESDELSPDRSLLKDLRVGTQSGELGSSSVGKGRRSIANTIEHASATKILSMYQEQRYESSRHESPDLDLPSTEPARKKQRQSKLRSFIDSPLGNKTIVPKIKAKKKKKKNSKTRSKSSIPITVNRLTTPINFEDGQGEGNSGQIFNTRMSHLTHKNINWIDILIKVCDEIIGTRTSALKDRVDECEDMATRRELKTKWQAVKSFGKELQDQLLEYTLDLDNAHSLERRLREEQKKKLHLREEILRVRVEREKVALQMDKIREQHGKAEEESLNRTNLNNAIHNLELTMDIAKDGLREGDSLSHSIDSHNQYQHDNNTFNLASTQVLLKSVAHLVTGQRNSSIGGLLTQVKDFNLFLERAALVLERRREG